MLCWLPPVVILGNSILDLHGGDLMSNVSFVGLRLFILASFCFPFLVFNLRNFGLLMAGLLGNIVALLFFDKIMLLFGVGYLHNKIYDPLYEFNNVRGVVSALVVSFSLFFLKLVVEANERINAQLLAELAEKNKLIKQQAEADVHQLNEQLTRNLHELSEREFILEQSQRIAKIGSWEYSMRKSFTFWSEEMYNIFGLNPDFNLRNKELSRIMSGNESAALMHAVIRLLRTREPFDLTVRVRNPIGYIKWVRIYAFPREEQGRITGMRGICHDITYYKEAEELLRTSENRYRSLFEQASDFISILDFKGNFIAANASWCSAFGYTREELNLMKIEQLIEPEQLAHRPIAYEALQRGDHILSERRMMRKDGTIVEVEANVKKLQEDQMLVIARDVTRLREVQKQIQLSEAKFRGAFEYSAIGMALVSLDTRWIKVNRELCQIVGYSEQELLELSVADITLPEDAAGDHDMQQKLMHGEAEQFQREKRYLHRDGSIIWVNVNVSLIKDNFGLPLYFVAQIEDITQEKRAAENLILSEANLNATINNTELLIWSVDRNFKILMYNRPFRKFIKDYYGVLVDTGARVFETLATPEAVSHSAIWSALYLRVLAGERIILEEMRFGIDFQYSLSPIVEADQIIGVSIYADNVTERKARDRELAEANKKIGELRLMALRSVMSPHFIFNVLNSIQYYIAQKTTG